MNTTRTEATMGTTDYTVKGTTLTLSEETTTAYEDKGSLGDKTRREVKSDARVLAEQMGKPIGIYSCDGIMFEQIRPE